MRGTVVNSSGVGLSGASVIAAGLSALTAADGSYALNNLPAGATNITASLTGFQLGSTTVTMAAGATTAAPVITLVSGSGTITGTVKNASGGAIAGASVGFGGGPAASNASGVYTLTGVPAGTVQLVASAPGFQSAIQNVTVSGGSTAVANFTLTAGSSSGTVTGKVTNVATGGVISGASASWRGGSTTTKSSGADNPMKRSSREAKT